MGDEHDKLTEDVTLVDDSPEVAKHDEPAAEVADVDDNDDAADDAAPEVNPHAAALVLDATQTALLKKLCDHYGVAHHGDVAATTKALGELTGHSQLGATALIKELAEKSGHR